MRGGLRGGGSPQPPFSNSHKTHTRRTRTTHTPSTMPNGTFRLAVHVIELAVYPLLLTNLPLMLRGRVASVKIDLLFWHVAIVEAAVAHELHNV